MGFFSEYLDRQLSFEQLTQERRRWLSEIAKLRGRDIIVMAADLNKGNAPISIYYGDLLPFSDQLANLKGDALDLIIETPGGSGEVAEDMVRAIRNKFKEFGVIVPGWAKSAGTLITMAADEILMGPASAVGPIDAQIQWQGKVFSAGELIEGMQKIKKEVVSTGSLNRAYIPILQGISPGELQRARNAQKFSKKLVTEWLAKYKFRNWTTHSSTQQPVTDEERKQRAQEIAHQLRNHRRWLTHGKSIMLADLQAMRLKVTDFSLDAKLNEAVLRYFTLLQMTFEANVYKVFETPSSLIYKMAVPPAMAPQRVQPDNLVLDFKCNKCGYVCKLQVGLGKKVPLLPNHVRFPADNKFVCTNCGAEHNLLPLRQQIEAQAKTPIVEPA